MEVFFEHKHCILSIVSSKCLSKNKTKIATSNVGVVMLQDWFIALLFDSGKSILRKNSDLGLFTCNFIYQFGERYVV